MDANQIDKLVSEEIKSYDPYTGLRHLGLIGDGQRQEVLNTKDKPNLYYQWLAALMRVVKPKQVVELGAAAGISTAIMAAELLPDAKLYSLDIDPTIAWKWMTTDFPNVEKIIGDSLDLSVYPKDMDLKETDVWFFDTLHTREQLEKEINLYKDYWKENAIVVFDDIHYNEEITDLWNSLPYDKVDNTIPNHYSGFGFLIT